MSEEWTRFSFWKQVDEGENPFDDGPVGPDSLFAHESFCALLPCAAGVSVWRHFPGPRAAAAYLRHMFLGACFSTWLVREEWDDGDEASRIPVCDLLDRAERAEECMFAGDIPLMREIVAELDAALSSADAGDAATLLQSALQKFNARWSHTPTWEFGFRLIGDCEEVGAAVYSQYDELQEEDGDEGEGEGEGEEGNTFEEEHGYTQEEWMDLCRRARTDPSASQVMLAVLKDCDSY